MFDFTPSPNKNSQFPSSIKKALNSYFKVKQSSDFVYQDDEADFIIGSDEEREDAKDIEPLQSLHDQKSRREYLLSRRNIRNNAFQVNQK